MKPLRLHIVTAGANDTAASLSAGMTELGLPPRLLRAQWPRQGGPSRGRSPIQGGGGITPTGRHNQSPRPVPRKRKSHIRSFPRMRESRITPHGCRKSVPALGDRGIDPADAGFQK